MKLGAIFVEGVQRFQKWVKAETDTIYKEIKDFYAKEYVTVIEEARTLFFGKVKDMIIELNEEGDKYDFSPKGVENDANSFKLVDYLNIITDAMLEIGNQAETDNFWQSNIIKFVSLTSMNWCYMPDHYLHDFEFKRLEFSTTGSIKNMN